MELNAATTKEEYTRCGISIDYTGSAEIPTRHERCIEKRYQTRIRGTGIRLLLTNHFDSTFQSLVKLVVVLSVRLSRNYISLSLGSIRSIMFVQAPALMVQQRSENSEEDSEEEGTGDVLQVDRSFAF